MNDEEKERLTALRQEIMEKLNEVGKLGIENSVVAPPAHATGDKVRNVPRVESGTFSPIAPPVRATAIKRHSPMGLSVPALIVMWLMGVGTGAIGGTIALIATAIVTIAGVGAFGYYAGKAAK